MATNRAQILVSAIDQTKAAFDSVRRGLNGLTEVARGVNGILANLGVAASAAGLVSLVKSAIDTGDALDEMSQRVGISVETLSVWIPAAQQSGVSSESFEKALRKLATTMVEAATGSSEAARLFSAVGVAFKNQDGTLRSTDEVLLELAERFKDMPDSAVKSALAMQLFGKSGAELIPFLNQGKDGIGELAEEMKALGVQMSSETAAQAGRLNDALDKMQLAGRSLGNQLAAALGPALVAMAEAMVESTKQGGTLRIVLDGLVLVLKALALGAATVGKAFIAQSEAIGAGLAALEQAFSGNFEGAQDIITELKGNLLKRLDELASFRDTLFDPNPIEIKSPQIQADPDLLSRLNQPKAPKPEKDATGAETALIKARLDAEFEVLKANLAREQVALDTALEDRLISVREYHARKAAIDQREIDAEIARRQGELARNQQAADTGKTERDRLRARAEVARNQAELINLSQRRGDVEQANARRAAQAERELAEALAQTREELARITGNDTEGDRRAGVERAYRDLKSRLVAEGDADGASLVDRLIDVKTAQANLAALESQWHQVSERMRNAQEAVSLRQQAGLLTESQARSQILDLQKQSAAEMERLLPAMQEAAQAIGPDAVTRVQAWSNELARTQLVADQVAVTVNGAMEDSFAQMFENIATGAATAKEAFAQFGRGVLKMIAQIAAQKMAQQVMSMFGGGAGGGLGGAVSSLFSSAGFASGGFVRGPGSATSDSIPARLSAGEYVVRAAAVRKVGVAFLHSINGLSGGPRVSASALGSGLAFSAGGLVPDAPAASPPPQVNQSVRIVNAIDPGVTHDHLQTPAGERVIVNVIGRNARAIRAAIQG